ncbi:hypothetical protein [Limobrevibacterium gyesilva]|uniref:hypothetical protein n=1 Tax=Limobrevibacterium gyesilva TaxID=2991712 RepID=UPI002227CBE0|nr:hypothetical protein [Limobrevibacterium gyesilva]
MLLINGLIAALGFLYGFEYKYPAAWQGAVFRAGTTVWLVGLVLLSWLRWSDAVGPRATPAHLDRAGAWLATCQLVITLFFFLPSRSAVIAGAALGAAGWMARRRWGAGGQYAVVVASGFALFATSILVTPLDPARADMLPAIAFAIDAFVAGRNPYAVSYQSITANPFFYPPYQWLAFAPPRLLGLDVRIVNLLCAAAMVAFVERACRRNGGHDGLRAGIYPVMFSAMALPMMHSGQVWPYWLAITVAGILALRGSWVGAVAALAAAAGMRQTALIPIIIILVALIAGTAPRDWLRAGLAAALILGIELVPVALLSPASLHHIFIDGPALALARRPPDGNPLDQVAVSNFLYRFGAAGSAVLLEALAAAAFLPLAWMAGRIGTGRIVATAGLAYLVVISFNPYLHRYYYVAGLLLVGIGIAPGMDRVPLTGSAERAARYPRRQVITDDTA